MADYSNDYLQRFGALPSLLSPGSSNGASSANTKLGVEPPRFENALQSANQQSNSSRDKDQPLDSVNPVQSEEVHSSSSDSATDHQTNAADSDTKKDDAENDDTTSTDASAAQSLELAQQRRPVLKKAPDNGAEKIAESTGPVALDPHADKQAGATKGKKGGTHLPTQELAPTALKQSPIDATIVANSADAAETPAQPVAADVTTQQATAIESAIADKVLKTQQPNKKIIASAKKPTDKLTEADNDSTSKADIDASEAEVANAEKTAAEAAAKKSNATEPHNKPRISNPGERENSSEGKTPTAILITETVAQWQPQNQNQSGPDSASDTAAESAINGLKPTGADAASPPANNPAATNTTPLNNPALAPSAPRTFVQHVDATARQSSKDPLSEVDRVRLVQRVAKAFQSIGESEGELKIRLSPPELGALKLEVSYRDGVLSARLETESTTTKNILLDNLPQLKERLAEQNVKIESFNVDVRDQSSGDSLADNFQFAREQQEQAQNRQRNSTNTSDQSTLRPSANVVTRPISTGGTLTQLNIVI